MSLRAKRWRRFLLATSHCLALVTVVLLLASPAYAQFTTVSGTITDPNGLPYSNATISAVLTPSSPGGYTLQGQPYSGRLPITALDSTGSFTVRMGDNGQITPGGSQWLFQVTMAGIPPPAGNGPQSFTVTLTITGASQSISANLSAVAPALGKTGAFGVASGCGTAVSKTVNYTAVAGDSGKTLVFNGVNLTLMLPAAAPSSTFSLCTENLNATNLTISPNGPNLDGSASSITLSQNQGVTINTDGTNYFSVRGVGGASGVSGQVVNQIPLGTTASTITGTVTNPTSPNGVPFSMCTTPSVGVAGIPTTCWPGISVTSQTGATYTLAAADRSTCIEANNAGAQTYTIPDAGGTNFQFGYNFCIFNLGAGTITVNRTAASTFNLFAGLTGSAQTTFALTTKQAAYFYTSTNNNWDVMVAGGGGGTPCTTTANSLQYNNAGAFGCVTEYTYASSTITSSAAGKMDLSAQNTANSLRIPFTTTNLSGSSGGGVRVDSGGIGGLQWDNAAGRFFAAAVAGSSNSNTQCIPTNSSMAFISQLFASAGPICTNTSAYITGSDYTNSTTTLSNVTGLSFSLAASTNYAISCKLIYQSSATTASLVLSSTGPASPTKVTVQNLQDTTAGAGAALFSQATDGTTFGFTVGAAAVVTTATDLYSVVDIGILNGVNAGTFQLQAKANGAGTVTIKVGSFCTVQ